MDKTKLKEILHTWNFWAKELGVEERRDERYFQKMLSFLNSNFIIVITGPRRSGKSVLIRQFAKHIIEQGKDKKETFEQFEHSLSKKIGKAITDYKMFDENILSSMKNYREFVKNKEK